MANRLPQEITIDGDGRQTRNFIYVKDLRRAINLALKSEVSGEAFQVATGEETSILDLAVVGQEIDMQHGPSRQGDSAG